MLRLPTWRHLFLLNAGILLSISSTQTAAKAADVGDLFAQARSAAAQLNKDAVTMESYTRSSLSWQSHAAQITQIKEHINKAGSLLTEMQSARGDAKPWHQQAIDRIAPTLKELASNTESIINHLNDNKNDLKNPTYQQLLKSNVDLSRELSSSINDTVDYDATKTKMAELESKLGK